MPPSPILPVTRNKCRNKLDSFTIFAAFAAGFIIGVPITYCVLFTIQEKFLYYVPERHNTSVLDNWRQNSSLPERIFSGVALGAAPVFRATSSRETDESVTAPRGSDRTRSKVALTRPFAHRRRDWTDGLTVNKNPVRTAQLESLYSTKQSSGSKVMDTKDMSAFYDGADRVYLLKRVDHQTGISQDTNLKLRDVVQGVYWTPQAEKRVPIGFGEEDVTKWRKFLNSSQVLKVEEGCGRMQNRLVTMEDGFKSCCRYRHNNDQIQGEIFSFYLGRLMGLKNLSPSALALVDPRSHRWSAAAAQVSLAQWSSERPVVMTKFIERLKPAFVPRQFRNKKKKRLHPIDEDLNLAEDDIGELVQWSDLIIFDYLTANLDRVVNNMYNERWNPDMMQQPTHNLAKTPEGLLVFLDNESGLLHGYRLLEKYEQFHRVLLEGLCIFKRSTVDSLSRLLAENSIESSLKDSFIKSDPEMKEWLPFLPDRSVRTLKERVSKVMQQVRTCESRFGTVSNLLPRSVTDR